MCGSNVAKDSLTPIMEVEGENLGNHLKFRVYMYIRLFYIQKGMLASWTNIKDHELGSLVHWDESTTNI